MNRTAASALEGADLVVLVVEATRWTAEDELALERIKSSGRPAILAVNKVDRVHPRDRLLPYIASVSQKHDFLEVVPISALKADGTDALQRSIAKHLPKSPAMFPDGELTDRGRELEPVLDALGRWGVPYMTEGPREGDQFRSRWLAWPAEACTATSENPGISDGLGSAISTLIWGPQTLRWRT